VSSRIQCFLLERTSLARDSLRRYSSGSTCPLNGYHNRSVIIRPQRLYHPEGDWDGQGLIPDAGQKEDERWPTHCECGYEFHPRDEWQINYDRLYRMPDGTLLEPEEAPAGAMWKLEWDEHKTVCVMLPPARGASDVWHIDWPARSGGRWERSGELPNLVVKPSILTPNYHGFLGGPDGQSPGILVEC
jgi:hypothetical protein